MIGLHVHFYVAVPDDVSFEDAEEWIEYELGKRGGIKITNPLCLTDLEAREVWVDR